MEGFRDKTADRELKDFMMRSDADFEAFYDPPVHPLKPQRPCPAEALERRVDLAGEDWARISWRRRPALEEPSAFDFPDFLNRVQSDSWRSPTGWQRETVPCVIPPRMTREEAWLWKICLEEPQSSPEHLLRRLQVARLRGTPPDKEVRAVLAYLAKNFESFIYDAPQLLRPFFAPLEIATLTVLRTLQPGEQGSPWPMLGFASHVAPYLEEPERAQLREALEAACAEEPDAGSPRSRVLLALLSTLGGSERLVAFIAAQPAHAWVSPSPNPLWLGYRTGHLDLLAGLPDEASFVREARRLGCLPRGPSDLRLWLAATEWRALDVARDAILAMRNDEETREMARLLALVVAPEAALPLLDLKVRGRAAAVAFQWLATHPVHAVVGLLPTAMGEGPLAAAAREYLARHAQESYPLASPHLSAEQRSWLQNTLAQVPVIPSTEEALPEALSLAFAGITPQRLSPWVQVSSLPPIRVHERRLSVQQIQLLLSALARSSLGETRAGTTLFQVLKQHASAATLDAFALKLSKRWELSGLGSEDAWALAATGHLGGDRCVEYLASLVHTRRGRTPHLYAPLALECLAALGTRMALTALEEFSRTLRHRRLRDKAHSLLEAVADSRGLTVAQLCDRIVPDGGLDAEGGWVFDYGPRQMRLVLGAQLTPLIRDANGRLSATLPEARREDDPIKVRTADMEWRRLRKTLRKVLATQTERLETAMVLGHRWTPQEFSEHLLSHPVMIHLLRLLVLGVYTDAGRLIQTFRATEDRTFADQNDDTFVLPQSGWIGVVHAAHLDESLKAAWWQVVEDYRIIAPFEQLHRRTLRPDPSELDARQLLRPCSVDSLDVHLLAPYLEELDQWIRYVVGQRGPSIYLRYFIQPQVTACIQHGPHLTLLFIEGHLPVGSNPEGLGMPIREVDPVVLSEALTVAELLHCGADRSVEVAAP